VRSRLAWRIIPQGAERLLERREDTGWRAEYLFSPDPCTLADFDGGCRFHQTSPESPFTRKRLCSMTTRTGRITLSGNLLIETMNGVRSDTPLGSEDEAERILRDRFGLLDGPCRFAPRTSPRRRLF
jgi:N-hydroxyarylamine O-acetyltransferase